MQENFNSRTSGSLTKEGHVACCLRLLLVAIVAVVDVAAADVVEANGSSYGSSVCGVGSEGKHQQL